MINTTCPTLSRKVRRLTSDLIDREWEALEPFFAPLYFVRCSLKSSILDIVDALKYMLRGGFP